MQREIPLPVDDDCWQPLLFDPAVAGDRDMMAQLHAGGRVARSFDALPAQLADLAKTRAAGKLGDREAAIAAILDGHDLATYGTWVFYPWSAHLVRLLPRAAFRELRLDRNRNKISREEQARLARVTVGVVGLSVGQAIAYALAQEGSAGHLKLADFDRLDLSNMNRLHAGVQHIGLRKTVLAARQILELDPYTSISLFHDGVTEANLEDFLLGAPRLDILVDECDGLAMKLALRQRARAAGIPVVMETNDRGMLDVERFDLEPERPLFHGLTRVTDARALGQLAARDRVAVVLDIIGAETLSARLGASLLEVDQTLSTWPQLAGDVALGAASVSAAVRRITLGEAMTSGRRYVDIESTLGAAPFVRPRPAVAPRIHAVAREPELAPRVRALLADATLAPSGGNAQPWRFFVDGERVWVARDRARSASVLDGDGAAARLALGAAVESMVIGAAGRGEAISVRSFPVVGEDDLVAEISFGGAPAPGLARLAPHLAARHTNRKLGARVSLSAAEAAALVAGAGSDATLELRTSDADLVEAGEILGETDRVRFCNPALHAAVVAELRWSGDDLGDGIDVDTLEPSDADRAVLRVIARADVLAETRRQAGGAALADGARKAIAASSAVGLVRCGGATPAEQLAAGRAVQRIWLEATALGLALQPMSVLPYLFPLLAGDAFNEAERARLCALQPRLERLFDAHRGPPAFIFRLGRAPATTNRSLRLPLAAVVTMGRPV